MGTNPEQTTEAKPVAMSMDDVAAMMIVKPSAKEAERPVIPAQADDAEDQAETVEEGEELADTETEGDDQEAAEEVPQSGESDEAEPQDEDGADPEYVDIRDDDTIEVMIDGKRETRTIAELKKAASGEGAIEKRLQEATELRKTAHSQATAMLERLYSDETKIKTALSSLDDVLFVPMVPAPPAGLKERDPAAYVRHLDAYETDQKRLKKAKEARDAKVAELEAQRAQRLEQYGKAAAAVIAKEIPELVDPKQGPAMLERLATTAKAYGYSEHEIAAALDPRMFVLVRDAMRYRAMVDRSKERKVTKDDLSQQLNKAPRKLRSGNTTARTVAATKAKVQQAAVDRAKKTGSVDDIAAMIVNSAKSPARGSRR